MRLKKLELQGFKSFMEKTEIVFNQGITGIVGPNGSGKSNIGDAVRWVLGEQSAKVLRGAKMEDVIFNGTQTRKRASFCEVSLYFDNEDHALRSAFSEVCVTRRVYRNGDSEYYLNKTACRLRDILELFRDTGIGREGYSLIGQGRIDEILSQKSEDRRQVFEEAAGIMTFRVRKEEAERKLQRTGENLTRVYDILNELEGRLGPLSEQAAVAREYQTLFEKLKRLEINIFLLRYDKVQKRVDELTQIMEGLHDVLVAHEARLNSIAQTRQELDENIQQLEQALSEARRMQNTHVEQLHDAELNEETLKGQRETIRAQQQTDDIQVKDALKKRDALMALGDEDTRARETRSAALEQARQSLSDAQAKLNVLTEEANQAEDALNEHKTALLAAVNRQSDARDVETRRLAMKGQMTQRLSEVVQTIDEMTVHLSELQKQSDAAAALRTETETRFDQLTQEAEKAAQEMTAKKECLRVDTENAQKLNLSVQSDISRLRVMEEMSRELEGYQQSVRRALEFAKGDNRVRGVLAKLISPPKELETAIDMVLGGALQNIVTENEDAAKRVIDYLRQNRLGRATFLPMTSVRSRVLNAEERRLLSMPGCLGVASELVSFDEEYRGVVENLLGRTVVATDLDHGIPIMRAGRHAFRLVTLAGDVMHSGGSMTGGTSQSRVASLLGREREIKELRAQVDEKRAALEKMRAALEQTSALVASLKMRQAEMNERVHQEEIAVAREQERDANAKAEWNAAKEQLARTVAAREQLEDGIAQVEADLKEAQSAAQSMTVDRAEMDQKIEALQRDMQQKRQTADTQREAVTQMQLQLAQEEHSLETLLRDKQRREEELEQVTRMISALKQREAQRNEQLLKINDQLDALRDQLARMRSASDEDQEQVERLEQQRSSCNAQQRECIRQSDEIHAQYEEDTAKMHRTELACTKAQNDLTQMADHMLNTYDLTYAGAQDLRSEEKFDLQAGEKEAQVLRGKIREMGVVNVNAIEEYAQEKARYDDLQSQRDDLLHAKTDLEGLIERLLKQMEKLFVGEFQKLGGYFSETFTRLFGGGQAELKLEDENDPLNCGIEIIAQPPGKKLQLLSLLSGGERALTAIAILFAMLKLKPTPFCILDEIEAALDEANIAYFADYLAEYAKTTQFVVVTHRKGTMERCDALYGVAMEERGVSRMVSVNLEDYQG